MATDTPEMQAIVQRIEKLEAENRRLKRAVLGVALLAAAVLAMGQARPSRILEADAFVLRDAAGRTRAQLWLEASRKMPVLAFYRENGQVAASLAGGEEPSLTLMRAGSDELVYLSVAKNDWGLTLADKKNRAGLAVVNSKPSLVLNDESGQPQISLRTDALGSRLELYDSPKPEAEPQLSLWASKIIGPHLWLNDGEGKERVSLRVSEGEPSIAVSDAEGFETKIGTTNLATPQTGETHRTSAASLVLFDKDNKILWRAP
jgi:hypothetical protein